MAGTPPGRPCLPSQVFPRKHFPLQKLCLIGQKDTKKDPAASLQNMMQVSLPPRCKPLLFRICTIAETTKQGLLLGRPWRKQGRNVFLVMRDGMQEKATQPGVRVQEAHAPRRINPEETIYFVAHLWQPMDKNQKEKKKRAKKGTDTHYSLDSAFFSPSAFLLALWSTARISLIFSRGCPTSQ